MRLARITPLFSFAIQKISFFDMRCGRIGVRSEWFTVSGKLFSWRREMDIRDQAGHQALRRVVVFCEKPWSSLEGVSDGFREKVVAAKAAVAELDRLAAEDKLKDVRVSIDEENHLAGRLYHTALAPIVRVARAVGREVPGIGKLGALPKRFTKDNVLATAKAVLRSTEAHEGILVQNGLPEDFRARLEEGIQAVEEKREKTELLRREAVKVTAAIRVVLARGKNIVACLDPVVKMMCRLDAINGTATLRAWLTAKRVHIVPLLPENAAKHVSEGGKKPEEEGKEQKEVA